MKPKYIFGLFAAVTLLLCASCTNPSPTEMLGNIWETQYVATLAAGESMPNTDAAEELIQSILSHYQNTATSVAILDESKGTISVTVNVTSDNPLSEDEQKSSIKIFRETIKTVLAAQSVSLQTAE